MVDCQTCGVGGARKTRRQTRSSQHAVVANDIARRGGGKSLNKVNKAANHLLFTFSNGYQPTLLNGAFKRLMRDSAILKDARGQNRTLYSLSHTHATLEPVRVSTDIHTLAKQIGNSAAVIDRHYSKLTATMAAERLA
jgi:hypothetical protein